jgi:hypothetical protein
VWCSLWGTDWFLKYYLDEYASHAAHAILYQNFALRTLPQLKIKISPYAALPRFNVWTRGCNWVRWNPAQLLSFLHFSSLPSSQPNVLPHLKLTFTRRTSGHCLGTFIAVNLALALPVKCSVSRYPPPFSSLSLSLGFRGLRNPKVHYHVHKSPPLVTIQINSVHAMRSNLLDRFNIIFASTPTPSGFPTKVSYAFHVLCCIKMEVRIYNVCLN